MFKLCFQVVYGDTDSVFVMLEGRSKAEAFVIGREMANEISQMFTKPVKLKFEKVYLPALLEVSPFLCFLLISAAQTSLGFPQFHGYPSMKGGP